MMTLTAFVVAVVFVTASTPAVYAQSGTGQNASGVPTFQSEIIVTAERGGDERDRLSVPTALLTRETIETAPGVTLAEAIEMLPGFQIIFSSGSGFRPTTISRGFFGGGEAEYVKLLVDGVPLGDAESGLIEWRHIPALAIERVEAVRGPASALYGDTALGGVVQVFTRQPGARMGRVSLDGGSYGHRYAAAEYRQPIGSAGVDILGSFATAEGFRDRSALREGMLSASVWRADGARQWSVRGAFDDVDREEPGALTGAQLSERRAGSDPLFHGDRDRRRKGYVAARHNATAGRLAYKLTGHGAVDDGERRRTLLLAPGLGDRAHRDIGTAGAGGSVETVVATDFGRIRGDLRSGIDVSGDRIDTTYHRVTETGALGAGQSHFDGRRAQFAAYASQSVNVSSHLRVDAGLRWDRIRDTGLAQPVLHTAWSPKVGATVLFGAPARQTALFAHASRAFKAPTLDQLFDPRPFPDFSGGTFVVSNPSLRPQRGRSVEGGVRQTAGTYRWELVAYRMRMTDEIDFDPATFTYANIGRSIHDGVELDAVVRAGAHLSSGIGYAWTRVVADGGAARTQLKNIPRHLVRPYVTLTLPAAVTVHTRYVRTAGAFADDANEVPLGDRSTIDMRIAKTFSKTTVRVDLINLTGDRYEELGYVLSDFQGGTVPFFYPAPGFAARAGVDFTF